MMERQLLAPAALFCTWDEARLAAVAIARKLVQGAEMGSLVDVARSSGSIVFYDRAYMSAGYSEEKKFFFTGVYGRVVDYCEALVVPAAFDGTY